MGINTKTIISYTCDKCHKECDDYFLKRTLNCGGDGRDVRYYAVVSLDYIVEYAGNQSVCNKCAAEMLRKTADELDKK
jgi:hypothetical protein